MIKDADLDIRRVTGVKLANDRTGEVIYTPPEGEALLRDKLANWERFLHDHEELDPLVRMAAGHYQFEAIHPLTLNHLVSKSIYIMKNHTQSGINTKDTLINSLYLR